MSSNTRFKRGEAVQNILITLVITAMIVTGVGYFFAGLATQYPSQMSQGSNPSYVAVVNNASAIYSQPHSFQNVSEGLKEAPDTQTGAQGYGSIVPSAFGLINFVESFFTAIVTMSGLPLGWVLNFMLLCAIVVVSFAIINFLRGGSRGL